MTWATRLNDMSSFQAQMNQMILGRQQQGASLGESLLASGRGSSTTGPGSGASDALMSGGNALSNLSTLLMLQKVLKNGGGDYGGGGVDYTGGGTSGVVSGGSGGGGYGSGGGVSYTGGGTSGVVSGGTGSGGGVTFNGAGFGKG